MDSRLLPELNMLMMLEPPDDPPPSALAMPDTALSPLIDVPILMIHFLMVIWYSQSKKIFLNVSLRRVAVSLLPLAIDRKVCLAVSSRPDQKVDSAFILVSFV